MRKITSDDEHYNMIKYHESTTNELIAVKNRVRNLIGRNNYGEEGRYKEAVLKNIISRFLPKHYITTTGFVVKEVKVLDGKLIEYDCSPQIDIMLIDTRYPNLFSQGDFYIATPESVKAIIEVKTNLENLQIKSVIERMNGIGEFIEKDLHMSKAITKDNSILHLRIVIILKQKLQILISVVNYFSESIYLNPWLKV